MSRVGKNPIKISDKVNLEIVSGGRFGGKQVNVKGPLGELSVDVRPVIDVELKDGLVNVKKVAKVNLPETRSLHGLYRSLIENAVTGVLEGYKKELEIVGIGYKAAVTGNILELTIGLNHPVKFEIPAGVKIEVKDNIFITVSGIDKQLIGQVAARIRDVKKPEPYKGKGIRYKDEYVRRKEGKTAA